MIFDYVSSSLIILGVFLVLSSSLGIYRFSNFFAKVHCSSLTDTIGVPLIALGSAMKLGFSITSLKILLLIPALWITSSTAAYMLCNSKYTNKDDSKKKN